MSGSSPAGSARATRDTSAARANADSSTHSVHKNLWDQAYEALKMKDRNLVNAYEEILSFESASNGESRAAPNGRNSI
jgi:hypothetical protein